MLFAMVPSMLVVRWWATTGCSTTTSLRIVIVMAMMASANVVIVPLSLVVVVTPLLMVIFGTTSCNIFAQVLWIIRIMEVALRYPFAINHIVVGRTAATATPSYATLIATTRRMVATLFTVSPATAGSS